MSTMKFCRKCRNLMLVMNEDKEQKILLYACRSCDYKEVAADDHENEIHHSAQHTQVLLEDLAADPTRPRTKSVCCAQCNHREALFYRSKAKGEEMALTYVCCNPKCGYQWRV